MRDETLVSLGEVAEFINGAAFKPEDWGSQGRPIIRIQNLTNPASPYNRTIRAVEPRLLVQPRDLLVSWSASLGVFEWGGQEEAVLNQHIFRVVPDEARISKSYLRHMLAGAIIEMKRHLHGATMQHINRREFLGTLIRLPALNAQGRIAEVLDRADALRAKRREALALLGTMKQAIFQGMFVAGIRAGWPVLTVADISHAAAGSIRTGPFGSQLLHGEFVDAGVAVLGIDNAVQNRFVWGARRYISEEKYLQLKRYTVRPGDVLITIMGTCGRCAVVPDDVPQAINTKHLCCISLDRSKCLPDFLHAYFLFHPVAKQYLSQTAKGAIMAGLNMAIIKQLPVVVPPIARQREFVNQVERLAWSIDVMKAHSLELQALVASLQQRAFAGAL